MIAENGDGGTPISEIDGLDLDPNTPVVVSSVDGARFHRPDGTLFVTACRTEFDHPVRTVTAEEAVEAGFDACRKPGCFGAR